MRTRQRLMRFGSSGVLNTVMGYAFILVGRLAGLGEVLANLLGYGLGLCLSFVLQRQWVFADRRAPALRSAARFAFLAAAAWCWNLAVVMYALSSGLGGPWAHALGVPVYAGVMYLGVKAWVFEKESQ